MPSYSVSSNSLIRSSRVSAAFADDLGEVPADAFAAVRPRSQSTMTLMSSNDHRWNCAASRSGRPRIARDDPHGEGEGQAAYEIGLTQGCDLVE